MTATAHVITEKKKSNRKSTTTTTTTKPAVLKIAKPKRQYTRGPRDADTKKEMLPPENPIEVREPGSSGETVNQQRLRLHYELQEEYVDLRARYYASLLKIQDLLVHGAAVQGGTYKVHSGVRLIRRPKYKQVVIDLKGEAYQQRVLEATRPHAHYMVRIE